MRDITEVVEGLLARCNTELDEQLQVIAHLRSSPSVVGDRRLDNVRLRTTYPEDAVRGLTAKVLEMKEAIAKHAAPLAEAVFKLEHYERELAETKQKLACRDQERADRKATGLYAEARRVINIMYRDHVIDEACYRVLTDAEIGAIARFIDQRRAVAAPPPGQAK